jgi:transposase-like protein
MTTINSEVKKEIIDKVKAGEKVADLASKYGISNRTIYAWLKWSVNSNISLAEFNHLKKENQDLKAIVGALMFQLEKLKKKK